MRFKKHSLSDLTGELDNGQLRQITGFGMEMNSQALECGKENLAAHFSCVGLVERFDESLLLMARQLGWQHIYYTKQNVTRGHLPITSLAPEVRAKIESRNYLDRELYREGQKWHSEAVAAYGPSFVRDLALFQVKNRLHGLARVYVPETLHRAFTPVRG